MENIHRNIDINFSSRKILILLSICFAVNGEAGKKRVCIVGAGLAGIVAMKYFSDYPDEFEPIGFEKNSDVGGLWIYTDSTTVDEQGSPVHSSIYKNLRTNTVKKVTVIPDSPEFGDEAIDGHFLKHDDVLQYLRNYTDHFNLRQHIKFNTNVEQIKPLPRMKWLIVRKNLINKRISETICDAVVVCNGQNVKGYIPKIWGIESFTGRLLHSHVYRKPETFVNQTVVVLGASFSGIDIGIDISSHAEKVYLSHRHGKLPSAFPANLEQVPGVVGAEYDKLVLSNGTKIRADVLMYCTGYRYDFPFLDKNSGIAVIKGGKYVHPVYKHMINVERPTMAIIGLPLRIIAFLSIPAQVNYFRAVLHGELSLPSREQMMLDAEIQATASSGKHHISSLNEFYKYYDELAIPLNAKTLPWWVVSYLDELTKLRLNHPTNFRDKRFVIHESNRTAEFV